MSFVLTIDEADGGPVLETNGFRGSSDSPWWDAGSMLSKLPPYVIFVQRALHAVNDFPHSTIAAPIWSARLRTAIESAGPLDIESVPVVIHDAVDPAATDVTTYSFGPQWKCVRGFRLRATPPYAAWRLVELPTFVMVSDAAAATIRAAGVRGVALVAPEQFRL